MFVDFNALPVPRRDSWIGLPDDEALLLWAVRRLVVAWPGSPAVAAALDRRWGDDGLPVLQLLRCWLTALAHHVSRPLTIGNPACAILLADEAAMLDCLRAGSQPPAARSALAALDAGRGAAVLLPLAAALASLTCASSGPRRGPGSASWAGHPA